MWNPRKLTVSFAVFALLLSAGGGAKQGAIWAQRAATVEAPAAEKTATSARGSVRANADVEAELVDMLPPASYLNPRFLRFVPEGPGGLSGDYYPEVHQASKGKVMRFKSMPIPVFITPSPLKGFSEACVKGFESWEHRTSSDIRFVQVANPDEARIRVVFRRMGLAPRADGCTLGAQTITKWKTRPSGSTAMMSVGAVPVPVYIPRVGKKYSVPPQIIEVNTDLIMSKPEEIRLLVLQNIVTHELGHALGLLGHSPSKTDLMYSITDEHSRISRRDINTIRKLYGERVDIPL